MNITEKEKTVLQLIAQNEYNSANYGIPESHMETVTWCNHIDVGYIYDDMERPSLRSIPGIVASLIKKELIDSDGETVGLTPLGFQIWKTEILRPDEQ